MRLVTAPPPVSSRILTTTFGGAALLVGALALRYANFAYLLKNLLFVFLLVITPGVTKAAVAALLPSQGENDPNDEKRRLFRVVLESALFISLIFFFAWWLAARRMSWGALGYAAALVLIVEAGAQFVEWHKARILTRVRRQEISSTFKDLGLQAVDLETLLGQGPVLYASVPIGILLANIVGLIKKYPPQSTLLLSLKLVLVISSLGLLYFVVRSFIRMISPMFVEANVAAPQLVSKSATRKQAVIGFVRPATVQVPHGINEKDERKAKEEQSKQDLNLSVIVSHLRKVYLYDAVHNVVLLALFAVLVSNSTGRSISAKWWICSFAIITFLLTQLPYVIGQKLMHDRVLSRFEGTELVEMQGKLKKVAPALPKSEFAAALIASNTAGGFLFVLFNEFLKSQTK